MFSLHLRQYYFIDEPRTWHRAQRYCRHYYTDLATVNDVQDLEKLAELTGSEQQASFVGLHKTWSFSSSDDYHEGDMTYWNWENNQPHKYKCGSVGTTGKWKAKNCRDELNFICYTGKVSEQLVQVHSVCASRTDFQCV